MVLWKKNISGNDSGHVLDCPTYALCSLFGNEKDDSFKGSLAGIYQTFNIMDLYYPQSTKFIHRHRNVKLMNI